MLNAENGENLVLSACYYGCFFGDILSSPNPKIKTFIGESSRYYYFIIIIIIIIIIIYYYYY